MPSSRRLISSGIFIQCVNVNGRNLIGYSLAKHFVSYISIDFDAHCTRITRYIEIFSPIITKIITCIMLSQKMRNEICSTQTTSGSKLTQFHLLENTCFFFFVQLVDTQTKITKIFRNVGNVEGSVCTLRKKKMKSEEEHNVASTSLYIPRYS